MAVNRSRVRPRYRRAADKDDRQAYFRADQREAHPRLQRAGRPPGRPLAQATIREHQRGHQSEQGPGHDRHADRERTGTQIDADLLPRHEVIRTEHGDQRSGKARQHESEAAAGERQQHALA